MRTRSRAEPGSGSPPARATRLACGLLALFGAASLCAPAQAQPGAGQSAAKTRQLALVDMRWTGDFDRMLARRVIRVDAPFSRSLCFNDRGREHGLAVELVREWERYLNVKYARELGKRPLTIYVGPASRDRLLSDVGEGLADVAIGNLTVTDERLREVDFVTGDDAHRGMNEVVVTGPRSPELTSLDDLSGKRVHVRPSSSYFESLRALNERFKGAGRRPVELVAVPDALEDEDLMEMENTGLVELLVVDDWKARMWVQVLPRLKVRADLVLRDDARTGWAIRKGSPGLAAEIDEFFRVWAGKPDAYAHRLSVATKRVRQLQDSTASAEYQRFQQTLALFQKYGQRYHFDPLMLAAQGYQESQLDQGARSAAGAIGVMQLMPATGAEMNVGDIRRIEPNIHAGVKYMDQLMSAYFPDANFSEGNRPLFAFASYNAGPGAIARARREAVRRGLDADKWFNNVEIVVAQQIGIETTTYVRNIYKYYVAYKLDLEAQADLEKARRQVAAPPR